MLSYPRSSFVFQLSTFLSHVVFLLKFSVTQSATDRTRGLTSLALKIQCAKRHPASQPSLSISTKCLSRSPHAHEMLLLLSSMHVSYSASCCKKRNTAAAALTVTQHALSLLQRKPIIYSLLYIHSSRGNTREYSWDRALPEWWSMPLSLSLSPIFWGWV